jgi:hypothetical protein
VAGSVSDSVDVCVQPGELMTPVDIAELLKQLRAPAVRKPDRRVSVRMCGQTRYPPHGVEVGELEEDLRQSGGNTVRITREEKEAIDRRYGTSLDAAQKLAPTMCFDLRASAPGEACAGLLIEGKLKGWRFTNG